MHTTIVGTAGHIDHGKTSLVRALTGLDLDRLPEEKARGITIALGFAPLRLPSGRSISIVDVPGHERFVRTMIAGATGIDAALLCVSALEGVMPQTREHLAILALLGVRHLLVALTMCDLVDPDMAELARLDVEEALSTSPWPHAPIFETAAGPVPQGLEPLLSALDALPPVHRALDAPLRLPVDRAFLRRGFGLVVTGTLSSGRLQDGEELLVLPAGLKARVRGMEHHGSPADRLFAGQRCAINLQGLDREDLDRGSVLVHPPNPSALLLEAQGSPTKAPAGGLQASSILDIRLELLPDAPFLPGASVRARILHGTAEVLGVIEPLGPLLAPDPALSPEDAELSALEAEEGLLRPGARLLAQLRTDSPLVALPGDRLIIRRESPLQTIAGGEVLDPWAPRHRRPRHAAAANELRALLAGDRLVFLERAGDAGLTPLEAALRAPGLGVPLGDRLLHPARRDALAARLLSALQAYHAEHPLVPGAPRREFHRSALPWLSDRAFEALMAHLADSGALVLDGPRLKRTGFSVQLSPAHRAQQAALEARARAAGLEGPRLVEFQAISRELCHLLIEEGRLIRVADRLLHVEVHDDLIQRIREHFVRQPELSAQEFKELTGLSRSHAIPMLEHLDDLKITRRQGDLRVAGSENPPPSVRS